MSPSQQSPPIIPQYCDSAPVREASAVSPKPVLGYRNLAARQEHPEVMPKPKGARPPLGQHCCCPARLRSMGVTAEPTQHCWAAASPS